jgi:hypothetical protein
MSTPRALEQESIKEAVAWMLRQYENSKPDRRAYEISLYINALLVGQHEESMAMATWHLRTICPNLKYELYSIERPLKQDWKPHN